MTGDVRAGHDLDIRVLVVVNIGRGDRRARAAVAVVWCATAQHAVVLGEHVAQLRDSPAQAGGVLDQVNS